MKNVMTLGELVGLLLLCLALLHVNNFGTKKAMKNPGNSCDFFIINTIITKKSEVALAV